jgi:zinc transport system substrate-binding protein
MTRTAMTRTTLPARALLAVPLALVALAALTAGGCAATGPGVPGDREDPGLLRVVAAFYPLRFVAERVGGDRVSVAALTPPGVEAHDLELTPSLVSEIAGADLVVYLSGFQPAVDDAVTAYARLALDVAEVVPLIGTDHGGDDQDGDHQDGDHQDGDRGHGAEDPHLWLDPDRLATIAAQMATSLGAIDVRGADHYATGAAELRQELAALDTAYAEGLAVCQRREIVVSHAAFGYLADRYDLTQIAITGLSPEDEPTPQRLAEVIHEAQRHGATTIFFEVLVSPRVAQVIAGQVGARTAVLDPIEGLAPGSDQDYLSVMRTNLDALRAALGCE